MIDAALKPGALHQRALQWSLLSQMLIAFARQITLACKLGASGGIRKAELLEAALYAALVDLSAEIAGAREQPGPRSAQDEMALKYLEVAHVLLGVIALLIRQIKADLSLAQARWADLAGRVRMAVPARRADLACPPAYLDSG